MNNRPCLKVGAKDIGRGKLFFIIEEGQANLGDFNKALAMIDVAAKTGADAIEFQIARAEDFYVKSHENFKVYLKREFSNSQLKDLVAYTKSKGMEFIAASLSHKLIGPLAEAGCSGFNINASDLNNPDIIDAVVDSRLPFFLSLLLAKEEEIEWAINRIRGKAKSNYVLLHGQHTMASGEQGVEVEHTSLGYLNTLKIKYQVPVGFIDHTSAVWMPAAAVSAGADFISKHLAISRSEKGPDWQVCLEPEEMKQAIIFARDMQKSINTKNKVLAPGEGIDRSIMRRSIVAARTIPMGKEIERSDIEFKRPGSGFDPAKYEKILGQIAVRNIEQDEQIDFSDIREKQAWI